MNARERGVVTFFVGKKGGGVFIARAGIGSEVSGRDGSSGEVPGRAGRFGVYKDFASKVQPLLMHGRSALGSS